MLQNNTNLFNLLLTISNSQSQFCHPKSLSVRARSSSDRHHPVGIDERSGNSIDNRYQAMWPVTVYVISSAVVPNLFVCCNPFWYSVGLHSPFMSFPLCSIILYKFVCGVRSYMCPFIKITTWLNTVTIARGTYTIIDASIFLRQ